jgi:D-alanine-D-alanine ligase
MEQTLSFPFKTTLLFGGTSEERRVSVASAQNISSVLKKDVWLWFQDASGALFECTHEELANHSRPFETEFAPKQKAKFASLTDGLRSAPERVYYLGFHGGEGEDGTTQKILESLGIAFTGSGSIASAKAFDKLWTKKIARQNNIRVAPEIEVHAARAQAAGPAIDRMISQYDQVILKPVSGGSSIGVYRLANAKELPSVLSKIEKSQWPAYLCEPFITGRELTIGVYDDGSNVRALPPSEIRLDENRDFDYDGKYLGKGCIEITPAEVSSEITEACQQLALKSHTVLGCFGYSRTDVIFASQGPVFIETNTLPGLTRASFIPAQLAAAQIPFSKFLSDQLLIAWKRKQQNPR